MKADLVALATNQKHSLYKATEILCWTSKTWETHNAIRGVLLLEGREGNAT